MSKKYFTLKEVEEIANKLIDKSLRDFLTDDDIEVLVKKIGEYGLRRKGLLGDLVEKYLFGIKNNSRAEADLQPVGVELKTTPIKKNKKTILAAKERLVFSMIDYDNIIHEKWETSSFLKKNKVLMLLFYLYNSESLILDYKFQFTKLLKLLEDISTQDIYQIQKDWEFIVQKIKEGRAHELSESDTNYLGACTKAANSRILRDQPTSRIPAKPRAFSFKPKYLNIIIQQLLNEPLPDMDSIIEKNLPITIEEAVERKISPYIGKTDQEIQKSLGAVLNAHTKNYPRSLINRILGVNSNKIEELEKANITLKVVVLEPSGVLTESISFPAFKYKELVQEVWYDEDSDEMAVLHEQLETKKFLFVVFQKIKGTERIILKRYKFWNFPSNDLSTVEKIWQDTIDCINEGRYQDLPKISDGQIVHVRPHGRRGVDTDETPQGTQETKRSFWINAKYIQNILENAG